MKRLLKFISVFCLICTACSPSSQGKKTILRTAFTIDPLTLDSRKNGDIFSSYLQMMLFDGLTRLGSHKNIEMALAQDVIISEDGLRYEFRLRDARWTDGMPITAYDLEYTWKKVLDKAFGAPCGFLFYPILNVPEALQGQVPLDLVGIRALDAKTFEVRLSHPAPYFLTLISTCPFFPIPKHIDEEHPNWAQLNEGAHLVSSGPYQLAEWDHNNRIRLRKSPTYWDRKEVALDGIDVFIISDEKTVLNLFERGEVDLISSMFTPLSPDALAHLKKEKTLQVAPLPATSFCTFNLTQPVLRNQKIRKALSLAINRQQIVQNITQMDEQIADRYLPSTMVSIHHQALTLMSSYDLPQAKQLFVEGVQELKSEGVQVEALLRQLTLSYDTKQQSHRIAQAIQQEWKEAFGLEVKLQQNDFKTHISNLERHNYAIALYAWWVHHLDPTSILDRFKSSKGAKNYPGYDNPAYVTLLNEVQNTNDSTHRFALLEQAEGIIMEDMPLTPLFHHTQAVLRNKRFKEIPLTALGSIDFKKIKPVESP